MLRYEHSLSNPARIRYLGTAAVVLVCLFVTYRYLWDVSPPNPYTPWTPAEYGGSWTKSAKLLPNSTSWRLPLTAGGNPAHQRVAEEYSASIMSQQDEKHKMQCPTLDPGRYQHLKQAEEPQVVPSRRKYFFALDLREIVDLLPTLMGSVIEVIRFLGPQNCAVSVVEGNSADGTYETLKLLQVKMDEFGVPYYLQTSSINTRVGDRIGKLAKLRNLALEPMMSMRWADNATVVFLNDVAICAEDILELIYQKTFQGADMACAMDYHRLGNIFHTEIAFYDVWVSRSMDGNSFFVVPEDGDWSHAGDMFPKDELSRSRFLDRKPFQAFACWNGATAIAAAPFLSGGLEFRRADRHKGECDAGEPTLLCKDMWNMGYGKIIVVPSISIGYSINEGADVKEVKGYTSNWTRTENESQMQLRVDWKADPPEMVRCIPSWSNQFWRPWNDTLGI